MLGSNFINGATVLAKQYPEIFYADVHIAEVYLRLLNNIKMIDQEFKKEAHEGKKYSSELLEFLQTKIQFDSTTHLYLVMEDIIKFAKVATQQNNEKVKNCSEEILEDSKKILKHIDNILFSGFDFKNFAALDELNIMRMKDQKKKDKENSPPQNSKEKRPIG